MQEHKPTGRCLCGNIQYEVTGETVWSGYCHCESCRRFTGSVVTNWLGIKDTDLHFTHGQPKTYTTEQGVKRGFCADCGSSITYQANHFPNYIQIHLGTLDNPSAVEPIAHVHCAERVPWLKIDDELPTFPGSAAAGGGDWQ